MALVPKLDVAKAIVRLSDKHSGKKLAREIAAYVIEERRSSELDAIMREVKRLREQQGIIEIDITTAFPASDMVKKEVQALVDGKQIIINEIIDKKVIGGVRMETSDSYLDLTVRNRLERLKNMRQGVSN